MNGRTLTIIGISAAFLAFGPVCHAAADTVIVSDRDCEAYKGYEPDPSVDYKPGTDVHGRAVAPADLGGGLQVSPDVNIPITVDIRPWTQIARQPQNAPGRTGPYPGAPGGVNVNDYNGQAEIGMVTVRDGKVYFNGQPLSTAYDNAVMQACLNYLNGRHDGHDH
jgi:hypothetical protein